jgi:hypothetical protein
MTNFSALRENVRGLGLGREPTHTLKALDGFSAVDSAQHQLEGNAHTLRTDRAEGADADADFPNIQVPDKRGDKTGDRRAMFGSRNVPVYVKNGFPRVLPTRARDNAKLFLPKVPGADENFGMIYNKPETENERNMQELWMARRRQEGA